MPHSSGGGSHGGGSHHSSHSSSGGSSGSSGTIPRVRHTAFAGSKRYVYYKKNKPEYIYANFNPGEKQSKARYFLLLFYIPFVIAGISMLISAIRVPHKLSTDYNTDIVIDDRAGVISAEEEQSIDKTFKKFFEKTGITPAVITVNNEDWQSNYTNLENYAYELYVTSFTDEKHWLIVYSQPFSNNDSSFTDWYWEGMQGNDTDNIITTEVADNFTDDFHRKLLRSGTYTVGSAIDSTFSEYIPDIMDTSINFGALPGAIILLVFITFHASLMLGITPGTIKYRKAIECPKGAMEYRCTYCGGIYVVGTCISCPHCGAPVVKKDDLELFNNI